MPRQSRHRLPALWLMTDERLGDGLLPAIAAMPRGSGIVFRHYGLAPADRLALLARVAAAARRHGHLLAVARPPRGFRVRALHLPAHVCRPPPARTCLLTAAVHDMRERARAGTFGADLLFVSPVFETASHPGARPLGIHGLARLAARAPAPVIALGGMTRARFRAVRAATGIHGFAAVAGLAAPRRRQKASAPPR